MYGVNIICAQSKLRLGELLFVKFQFYSSIMSTYQWSCILLSQFVLEYLRPHDSVQLTNWFALVRVKTLFKAIWIWFWLEFFWAQRSDHEPPSMCLLIPLCSTALVLWVCSCCVSSFVCSQSLSSATPFRLCSIVIYSTCFAINWPADIPPSSVSCRYMCWLLMGISCLYRRVASRMACGSHLVECSMEYQRRRCS